MSDQVLSVEGLHVSFRTMRGEVRAVRDVSFEVRRGELVGMVGESGSGKSVTSLAVMQLLPANATWQGHLSVAGHALADTSAARLAELRRTKMSIIFQDPLSALNPLRTIGSQIAESVRLKGGIGKEEAVDRALELLDQVEMPHPPTQLRQYPHEMSGGMNQRAMIAMALASDPMLLVADEPTTALDATTQMQIMSLLHRLGRERDMAVLLITHDLGAVKGFADRVLIMYAGRIVEDASSLALFDRPWHPYTEALLAATPSGQERLVPIPGTIPDLLDIPDGCVFHPRCHLMNGRDRCRTEQPDLRGLPAGSKAACHFAEEVAAPVPVAVASPAVAPSDRPNPRTVLTAEHLTKVFETRSLVGGHRRQLAVDDVSFSIDAGRTLALVGESGSGKTTTARMVLRLTDPTSGTIAFGDDDLGAAKGARLRRLRSHIGIVFQDPDNSLDPRMSAAEVVAEPLAIHGAGNEGDSDEERVAELLAQVGIDSRRRKRMSKTFSGGERQRLALARALALRPALIVCDEPTTMLDVSVQAQIVNLLVDIQAATEAAYLFIAHDLAVVRHVAHDVAVMHAGRIVEMAPTRQVFAAPRHPYTRLLLSASPDLDHGTEIEMAPPDVVVRRPDWDSACRFASTCWKAQDVCRTVEPPVHQEDGVMVRCHFPEGPDPVPTGGQLVGGAT